MLSIRRWLESTVTTGIEIYPPTAVICNWSKHNLVAKAKTIFTQNIDYLGEVSTVAVRLS